jgi:ABC-type bacteriocin/lantibiotic exporter with double-glycine peptidase domain
MSKKQGTAVSRVAEHYIRLLAIKVTPARIRESIETNPDFPSLYCLSDTFHRYHIDNNAYEVPPENVWQLDPPFVAYLNIPTVGKDFVLVSSVTDKRISYFHASRRPNRVTKEEFLQHISMSYGLLNRTREVGTRHMRSVLKGRNKLLPKKGYGGGCYRRWSCRAQVFI